jgi:hypothetical protein
LAVGEDAGRRALVEHALQRDVGQCGGELEQGPGAPGAFPQRGMRVRAGEPDQRQPDPWPEAVLLGHERGGRRVDREDHAAGVARQGLDHVPGRAQAVGCPLELPELQAEVHDRTDRVQPELELGDHAEVPTAPR